MDIIVRYKSDITPLETIKQGDWIDLRTAEDVTMEPGEYKLIKLGVCIKLPEGYEAIIAPRSSTYKNFGIIMTNSIGVIDESYCGDDDEWRFPAFACETTIIPKNTRICQFRIIEHQPKLNFVTVDKMESENRGGLGSTGRD